MKETTSCPFCQREAGFEPSTGEVFCQFCGILEPPNYEPMRRPFATVTVWHFNPSTGIPGECAQHPWHAAYLEMHLMGIERSMFRKDKLSNRFNQAAGIEFMYKRMGLISYFSMN